MSEPNITILSDVKKFVGLNPNEPDEFFDSTIMSAINTSIAELAQIGLRSLGDFTILSGSETWDDYLGENNNYLLALVKDYIQTNTRLIFDPPQSGSLSSALEERLKKTYFNIQTAIELHKIEAENDMADLYVASHGSIFYP